MKQFIFHLAFYFITVSVLAQDTIPRPSIYDEGYFFVGSDDVLKFKGYAQFDAYFPIGKSPGISEFLIRRARFVATGFFQKKFRYMLYARFDKGKPELYEAFLEARHIPFAKIRAGQFKVPFSLSNLQSSSQSDFIGRPFFIENFSPSQDIGIMMFGEDGKHYMEYAVGLFNGRVLNKKENNNGKQIIGRLVIAPFKTSKNIVLSNFYLGSSISNGLQNNDYGFLSYNTNNDVPVISFKDSVNQSGRIIAYNYDLEWYIKNFSAKAEYLHHKAANLKRNTSNYNLISKGYYISASYLLTGENKKRNEVIKPKKEFDPKKGYWGAFEVAARYEKTNISNSIVNSLAKGTDELTAITLGTNWYLNDDVRAILNYTFYQFKQPIVVNNLFFSKSNILLLRIQYQF